MSDVTEERTAEERLLHDSVRDNLTGLANRAALHRPPRQRARPAPRSRRRPSRRCLVLDIDRFKHDQRPASACSVGDLDPAHRRAAPVAPAEAAGHARPPSPATSSAFLLLSEIEPERIAGFADLGPARAARADLVRRQGDPPDRLDRHRACTTDEQAGRRQRAAASDAEIGDVSRQAPRRRPHRGVPPGAAAARRRHARPWRRISSRAIGREEIKVLYRPVVRLEDRTDRRLRGRDPLGPSEAWPRAGERVPDACRAQRA